MGGERITRAGTIGFLGKDAIKVLPHNYDALLAKFLVAPGTFAMLFGIITVIKKLESVYTYI